METLKAIIFFINLISALSLIFLILIQQGKGADAGTNFGSSSSSQSIFGSSGSASFLSRATSICVIVFFSTCLLLAFFTSKSYNLKKIIPVESEIKSDINNTKIPE